MRRNALTGEFLVDNGIEFGLQEALLKGQIDAYVPIHHILHKHGLHIVAHIVEFQANLASSITSIVELCGQTAQAKRIEKSMGKTGQVNRIDRTDGKHLLAHQLAAKSAARLVDYSLLECLVYVLLTERGTVGRLLLNHTHHCF